MKLFLLFLIIASIGAALANSWDADSGVSDYVESDMEHALLR